MSGFTRVARRAGIHAASVAGATNDAGTAVNTSVSNAETSTNILAILPRLALEIVGDRMEHSQRQEQLRSEHRHRAGEAARRDADNGEHPFVEADGRRGLG